MMKWFMLEGKYCVLFYIMMAICFQMGYLSGIGFLTVLSSILWTVVILFGCVLLSSYLMVLDYKKYRAAQILAAQEERDLKEQAGE
jgi:hypothetical protein